MEEQFNQWLRHEVEAYNAPPPVPGEAMWARVSGDIDRIVATNATRALAAKTRQQGHALGRQRHWWRAMIGMGAAAIFAFGIVIGRWMLPSHATGSPGSRVAVAPVPAHALPMADEGPMESQKRAALHPSPLAIDREHAAAAGRLLTPTHHPDGVRDVGSMYVMTTEQHLADAEALLTAFQTDAQAGRVDPRLAYWAQDLLNTTRILYDAPVTHDPQLKALLADLELVLVQLATYEPGRKADLGLAEKALDQSAILLRLRRVSSL